MVIPKTMTLSRRGALFDLDGVILYHPPILKKVIYNVERLVKEETGIEDKRIPGVNRTLFRDHGHTLLGLNAVYGKDLTMDQFVERVYDRELMEDAMLIGENPDALDRARQARRLIRLLRNMGVAVGVFSNSPNEWCQIVLESLGLLQDVSAVVGCDTGHIKPFDESYHFARSSLTEAAFADRLSEVMFVEDTFRNLTPVIGMKDWIPVHVTSDDNTPRCKGVHRVRDLDELTLRPDILDKFGGNEHGSMRR
jgi:FMN phosphatase YigB (HAD superfamily)